MEVRASGGSTAFRVLSFVVPGVQRIRYSNRKASIRYSKSTDTLFEMEKSQSCAGGTAGAAAQPCFPKSPTRLAVGSQTALVPPWVMLASNRGHQGFYLLFARARCSFWPVCPVARRSPRGQFSKF